jgi:nicotinamidase-related amidase
MRMKGNAFSPLKLTLRSFVETSSGAGDWRKVAHEASWDPERTAVVICDMWNRHWCDGATARVAEMAPRMNQVIRRLRDQGALIIHCPSDTMDFYTDHPGRELALAAPKVPTEFPLETWVGRQPELEPPLPVDDSDGGCDDNAPRPEPKGPPWPWTHQIDTIEILAGDAITDDAQAYYLMRQRGIMQAIVMGVHANMCVLGRPFAIRQLVRSGMNVVLMRDMTDAMYNPKSRPFVDHFTGTGLVIRHIEKYWCPTVASDQIIGGEPFRFTER